ncbi:hypothetical protein BT69DRAFT_1346577 [Atractiella rhizophila]|nr:hypothetical protein BT69DRAFT_1346577 [Atractiella rhizophila]
MAMRRRPFISTSALQRRPIHPISRHRFCTSHISRQTSTGTQQASTQQPIFNPHHTKLPHLLHEREHSQVTELPTSLQRKEMTEVLVKDALGEVKKEGNGGKKIDGTEIAKTIRTSIGSRISETKSRYPHFSPSLAIIQQGTRADSTTYVNMKKKAALECGIDFQHITLDENLSEREVVEIVEKLNGDEKVHGILVQLPLSDGVGREGERRVVESISPEKDVDGFHAYNIGLLSSRTSSPIFSPCTPLGVIALLESTGIDIAGKHAVVLGRSDIVGTPVCALLRRKDATVTQCHSRTSGLENIVKMADILIAAIGKPEFVKGEWLKEGAIVIDVGTNFVPDASKKTGQRLVGDVHYDSASKVASHITPVPGGVGPMTVAMLMRNTLTSAERFLEKNAKRTVRPLKLNLLEKVPSDIVIAKSQRPKLIDELADEIGVPGKHLELYGKYKAKVSLEILNALAHRKDGKYIVVAGITPTPLGEGKSTTTIGLVQALGAHLDKVAFACVRQPSQGPTFGIKGGAAGGGYSQVIPMEEFNLHLTGVSSLVLPRLPRLREESSCLS